MRVADVQRAVLARDPSAQLRVRALQCRPPPVDPAGPLAVPPCQNVALPAGGVVVNSVDICLGLHLRLRWVLHVHILRTALFRVGLSASADMTLRCRCPFASVLFMWATATQTVSSPFIGMRQWQWSAMMRDIPDFHL